MSNIIDQLKEQWDNAERGIPRKGDTVIANGDEGYYEIMVVSADFWNDQAGTLRILERAKDSKPRVVMAGMQHAGDDTLREPFIERVYGYWESASFSGSVDHLIDPVPLVEVPDHGELRDVLFHVYVDQESEDEWPGSHALADAVLELLRGER